MYSFVVKTEREMNEEVAEYEKELLRLEKEKRNRQKEKINKRKEREIRLLEKLKSKYEAGK